MYRFLIVDDSKPIRLLMRETIRDVTDDRAEFVEASDGKEALQAFSDGRYDAVFLDLVLPGDSGLEVLEQMLEVNPRATIVLITGLPSDHPDVVKALSHGAWGRMSKPITPNDLQTLLTRLQVERSGLRRIGRSNA